MKRNKSNPARERIWSGEPMGLVPTCQQCKDCYWQFVSRGKELNEYDWMKAYCQIFKELKPAKILTGEQECPSKLSFQKVAEMYAECEREVHEEDRSRNS